MLPSGVCSFFCYKGSTYVGLNNRTVAVIDINYQLHTSFITCPSPVFSITVYKDMIYLLDSFFIVKVYDSSGTKVRQWKHSPYHGYSGDMMTVVSDQVVITDPAYKRIAIYSLIGQILRHVPCSQLAHSCIDICAVDDSSVIVLNHNSAQVFRFNIATGDVLWTTYTYMFRGLQKPRSPRCWSEIYVLVASCDSKTVVILDIRTGESFK